LTQELVNYLEKELNLTLTEKVQSNNALQLTFDPSALFAGAKSTAASNAAELWR